MRMSKEAAYLEAVINTISRARHTKMSSTINTEKILLVKLMRRCKFIIPQVTVRKFTNFEAAIHILKTSQNNLPMT